MSNTVTRISQATKEWLVLLPDCANVLDRRIKIRPQHSPNFVQLHKAGWVTWAGPLFQRPVPVDDPRRPFCGSIMVVNDKTPRNIFKKLSSDIYVKEEIWNMENTRVFSMRTLKRRPEVIDEDA